MVNCVTSSKERRKRYVPKVVLTRLLIASVAKYMMKYCLSGSELCTVQAEWLTGSFADQKLSCQKQMDCLESEISWKHLHPCQQCYTAQGFLISTDFCERCWFFICTWSSTPEWCLVTLRIRKLAGLLVKIHVCESCTWRGSSREVSKVLKLAKGLFFSSEKPSGCY